MRKLKYLMLACCLLSLSCTKDVDKFFTLSENVVDFASEGGELEITVTANTNWEVMYDKDFIEWLDVKIFGETGNGTIQMRVNPNTYPVQRRAKITVTGQGTGIRIGKEISITQEPTTYLNGVATVLGRNPDCGTFMIQFDEIPFYGKVFHGINLPEAYQMEGERIEVLFRSPHPDEVLLCTTMGPFYPSVFIVNAFPYFAMNLKDRLTLNQQKVTITEGIWGTLLQREGDCMPKESLVYNWNRCRTFPVQREILVYEYTLWFEDTELSSFSPTFFETVFTKLIAKTTCDKEGFFELALEPGKYSVFIRENGMLYADGGDGQGGVCPVVVEPDNVSEVALVLNYAVY